MSCPPCTTELRCCRCRIGLLEMTLTDTTLSVRKKDLRNPSYKNADYDAIRFLGEVGESTVTLPKPVDLDASYTIELENSTDSQILFGVSGGSSLMALQPFDSGQEYSLEEEIGSGAVTSWTYRTRARVTPLGVFRVPGFRGPA